MRGAFIIIRRTVYADDKCAIFNVASNPCALHETAVELIRELRETADNLVRNNPGIIEIDFHIALGIS